MFNLEIRKRGDIKNVYNDIDFVLQKYGIQKGSVTDDLRRDGVAHALQKMFRYKEYMDVCTIRRCEELSGIHIPVERMQLYNSQHCVSWNEMLEDFRIKLIAMILDDFRSVLMPTEEKEIQGELTNESQIS